jgi:outer membrane biosynthesis protein TonB
LKRGKRPASEPESARRKALGAALLGAGKSGGSRLIRLGAEQPATVKSAPQPATPVREPTNPVLAHALRSAGLTAAPPPPAEPVSDPPPAQVKPTGARSAEQRKPTKRSKPNRLKPVPPAKQPTSTKRKRKKPAPAPTPPPPKPRRSEKDREAAAEAARERVQAFIGAIGTHTFPDLLANWQRHVERIDYIRATGINSDRLPAYLELVEAIEREWQRRGALRRDDPDFFVWPSTDARSGAGGIGEIGWVEEGVLRFVGYSVSKQADLTLSKRQAILRRVFRMTVPPFEKPAYLREWGDPDTPARLRKMAESIASFARLAKGQSRADKRLSVDRWEADLAMLREEFYVGQFGWPDT